MNVETFATTLTIQYRYTDWSFNANLKDLTAADGLKCPAPAGNCANWVAGHIVQSRGLALKVMGQELPFSADKYDRYQRASDPITGAEGSIPIDEMVADFAATAAGVKAGLAAMTPESLAVKAPFSPGNDEKETVGSLMAGMVFHEAYHIGQLGVLRRLAGAEGMIK